MSPAPLPDLDWPLTRPFWQAAENAVFVMPRCEDCGRYVWYPEEQCPHCDSQTIPWVDVSGRGTLFSWAEVRHPLYPPYEDLLPYVVGVIALEEDPRVRYVTRVVDCDASALEIEMPMRVVFRELAFKGVTGSVVAPVFHPAR